MMLLPFIVVALVSVVIGHWLDHRDAAEETT
jgi:hypothetical protein